MTLEQERLKILEMIESGQITVQEGIELLNALAEEAQDSPSPADPATPTEPEEPALPPQQEVLQGAPDPAMATHPDAALSWAEQSVSKEAPSAPESSADEGFASGVFSEEKASSFESQPEVIPPEERFDPKKLKWRNFWWLPMGVGMGILIMGALWMYWAWSASGFGFWFICAWFPFLLGVAVVALAWSSRTAPWLHLRVKQKPGEKPERISISLPLPLRLTAWFLRAFGDRIPHMGKTGLDEVILALEATSPETPFYLEVDEGEDGEHVEIYIG